MVCGGTAATTAPRQDVRSRQQVGDGDFHVVEIDLTLVEGAQAEFFQRLAHVVAGAGLDLMIGGASLFLGAALGSAAGAAIGYLGLEKISESWDSRSDLAKTLLPDLGGQYIGIGPVKQGGIQR